MAVDHGNIIVLQHVQIRCSINFVEWNPVPDVKAYVQTVLSRNSRRNLESHKDCSGTFDGLNFGAPNVRTDCEDSLPALVGYAYRNLWSADSSGRSHCQM